jgi:Ca2+-transporting ATPase
MRVLAVAFRLLDQIPEYLQTDLEQNLTFLGLFGMVDPPRPEVPAAVALTRTAGIRTAMLTTDQPLTAAEIARQLGLMDPQATRPALKKVLTGAEVEAMPAEELEKAVKDVQVFVRLSPSQKVKALEALQGGGQVVSITGDDVIDAPALRQADVGAAMGVAGTDAAREAADVVLLDDSFASLVEAVKEGRVVTENLRLFLHIAASGAIARALVMLLAPLAQGVPPLLPLQFIWLGLLVDGFLGVGLVTGGGSEGLMKSPPAADSTGWLKRAAWAGGLIGLLTLALGGWFLLTGRSGMTGVIFSVLALAQLVQAWVLPARTRRSGWMLAATVFVVLFMAAAFLPGGPG